MGCGSETFASMAVDAVEAFAAVNDDDDAGAARDVGCIIKVGDDDNDVRFIMDDTDAVVGGPCDMVVSGRCRSGPEDDGATTASGGGC